MSTAAEPGGFVVITEVSRKDAEEASSRTPPKRDPLQKFYQGEPLPLGITQILCGIVHILFGVASDQASMGQPRWYIFFFQTGTPFWYGAMVRSILIMNIITAVASVIALIIYTIHINTMERSAFYRRYYDCNEENEDGKCLIALAVEDVNIGMVGIMLTLAILGFCLSIATSAFGCKTLCRTSYSEVSVVIYQTSAPQPSQPNVSAVQTSHPDIGAHQPSFKDFENARSSAPIWKQ